ncbi:major facilitator superfamily MFS_1 [Deinococcus proteolyticus MRP]|uniref:Major facilitator superfamily MFS_1 n=1 Tax=Deinococcus proteolyticus (strain ATCC 35074 / DSM 20540 / JCM 6276 / NBRC 101906 / NCIMB 13154 / VKM Ac-1939 / CCM 2703 / MRP) TaxID=693977 RepID=F0RN85_DEIPM|nr:MFS transporter [Deinococcus proteolyticus]ADY26227.1 major facilitator superfamily MFS_1 [Deinococcus proteolyticus MRP]
MTASPASSHPHSFPVLAARLWPLYLSQALATGATTVSTILASLVMSDLGSERLSGLPATLISVAAALSAAYFGALMLRRGRRLGLASAFGLGTLGGVLGFLGASWGMTPLFLAGAATLGAAQGGFQQARYAAAESVPAQVRGLALGLLMMMSVLGSWVMTGFGVQITALGNQLGTGEEVTGWLVGAGLLGLAAGLMALWRPVQEPAAAAQRGAAAPARPSLAAALAMPGVKSTAAAFAAAQAIMVTLMSLTPLRAHHMGQEHGSIAQLISGHIAGMFAFGLLTGPLIDRLGLRFGFVAGGALLLLAAATSVSETHAGLLLSMFVLGLGWNLISLTSSKVLARFPAAQGPSDSLAFAASALGTLLGGLLMAQAGFPALAAAAGVLALLPLWSAWRVRPH